MIWKSPDWLCAISSTANESESAVLVTHNTSVSVCELIYSYIIYSYIIYSYIIYSVYSAGCQRDICWLNTSSSWRSPQSGFLLDSMKEPQCSTQGEEKGREDSCRPETMETTLTTALTTCLSRTTSDLLFTSRQLNSYSSLKFKFKANVGQNETWTTMGEFIRRPDL